MCVQSCRWREPQSTRFSVCGAGSWFIGVACGREGEYWRRSETRKCKRTGCIERRLRRGTSLRNRRLLADSDSPDSRMPVVPYFFSFACFFFLVASTYVSPLEILYLNKPLIHKIISDVERGTLYLHIRYLLHSSGIKRERDTRSPRVYNYIPPYLCTDAYSPYWIRWHCLPYSDQIKRYFMPPVKTIYRVTRTSITKGINADFSFPNNSNVL